MCSQLEALRGILMSSLSRENLRRPRSALRVTFLDHAGAAPVDVCNKQSRPSSGQKGKDTLAKDREERLRALKERQNEERQRKLEELRQQALAAQKFREQKEEERRRRMEELRQRDTDKRMQVEERKRQIWEAERDRREAILRKNQEREARIDSKRKNERSSIVFAFGSSTPRMLEPADTGGSFWGTRRATSTSNVMMFAAAPLTRRSSERELDGGGKKRATSASGLDRKPGEGDEVDVQATPVYVSSARVNRRKTDLMPTIPSPRDLTPRRGAAPGRAFSMSRLDQLAQPRTRRGPPPPVIPSPATTNKSMSRSMSHLAAATGITSKLRRSEASKSMVQLSSGHAPTPPPRVNRTERLRQRAKGLRSGEATPSPRPLSALSQHSVNSVGSGVSLRARPTAAPRRPRPFSIAVTGVSHEPAHRHSIAGELKTAKLQSPSSEKEVLKPPLPKVHATKKQTKPETPPKKPIEKLMKHAKASPRVTPKATPLQSPGSDSAPSLPQELPGDSLYDVNVMKEEIPNLPFECDIIEPEIIPESIVEDKSQEMDIAEDVTAPEITPEPDKEMNITPKEQNESELEPVVVGTEQSTEQEADMTASMIAKTRITTEEEAKAALAERRRLAREQAEREAELERQRLEEEKRKEEERLRQEEEEQRCFEEEQLRLVEEARKAEEQRLLLAIQENERREEEERKRREEEAKAKAEKEEADKKAREEAERLRKEMDERLKKEEEERIARRKRVEAIMLRTRGKNTTPTSTPTKGQLEGDGDVDFVKETSPLEDSKGDPEGNVDASNNGQSVQVNDIVENGKVSASETKLIDSSGVQPMETSQDSLSSACSVIPPSQSQQSNGHRNGVQYSDVDFVNVDNVKQNNTTNNILDFSEFDTFSTNNVLQPVTDSAELEQILDLNSVATTGKLANEDNVNSNVTSNGPNAPLIAFQDNLTKKQDSNSVTDLLS